MSSKTVIRELTNNDNTVIYSGEAIELDGQFELSGQGKLQTFGYQGHNDMFNGRFMNNLRQGQATLVKKDTDDNSLLEFEGTVKLGTLYLFEIDCQKYRG